ncbi:hypothetical protein H257_07298 [Aphanomyces astaci]|uniref:Uncharacterized protein n=1 Tax=Aphanomyces astaci TaxID=112090 RepID=W4GIT9_APHAT|nr:hypothetical protein H257_07298 [Aphanomyces astaci]ETV79231.1 hypothetical protein H257_07298 [Aphanomyces astaci]|eukprot:XP_009831072.1 hypothetical protein H257_07298 [Aphanomyces astaci]
MIHQANVLGKRSNSGFKKETWACALVNLNSVPGCSFSMMQLVTTQLNLTVGLLLSTVSRSIKMETTKNPPSNEAPSSFVGCISIKAASSVCCYDNVESTVEMAVEVLQAEFECVFKENDMLKAIEVRLDNPTATPAATKHPDKPPRKAASSRADASTKRTISQRVLWTKDAVGDGKTSMDAVIAWMSVETNYVRWKGGNKRSGSTKASLASEVVERLKSNRIHYRTAKDGIVDEDSIQKEVQRLCPYYYVLDEVMRDRASTAPLVTSDNLQDGNSSDKDVPPTPVSAPNSAKKRTAAAAKMDDWSEISARAYALK